MNLFCSAKTTKPGKNKSIKACFFSSTGNMFQISDRKRESSWVLEDICKGDESFNLGRNRVFRGNFDYVQFSGRLPKSGDETPKSQGRRVSGCECQRGV